MPERYANLIDNLNKATYASSSITAASIGGYLVVNKEVIFIVGTIIGAMIGVMTFLSSLYFQWQRNQREKALFEAQLNKIRQS